MPNPNKCDDCQCPSGFGGKDCSEREPPSHGLTCGETMEADADWKPLSSSRVVGEGDGGFTNRSDPYRCTWHIKAPDQEVIEFKATNINMVTDDPDSLCTEWCRWGGLKIKGTQKSWKPEGMKLCCEDQQNITMTTSSNLLVIEAFNNIDMTDFTVEYRIKSDDTNTTSGNSTTVEPPTAAPNATENPVKVKHFGIYTLVLTRMTFNESEAYCASEGRRLAVFHKKSTEYTVGRVFNLMDKDVAGMFWIGMKKAAGKESPFQWVDGSPIDYENWPTRKPKPTAKEQCVLHWHPYWAATNCAIKYASVCEGP
uniref:C-type lectin domain-containing protein n=1 Tax=Steinernema glaseri TaxID=37863 RepID=A0A1I7Z790_9BILA